MKRFVSLLWIVILVELVVCGRAVWQRANRVAPPTISMSGLDRETSSEINDLQRKAEFGTAVDWRNLAEAYLGEGFFPQAEQAFGQAALLNPADEQALYGQGFCLERMGRMKRALPIFKQLVDSDNSQLVQTCWYQIGRNHLRLENWQGAEQAFRQIDDFPPAAYQLAKLLIRTDRVEQGVSLAQQQLDKLPNSLKLTQLLAYAAETRGDQELAWERRQEVLRAEYQLTLEYGLSYIGLFRGKMGLQKQLARCLNLKDSGTLSERANCLNMALATIEENGFLNYQSVYIAAAQVAVGENRLKDALALLQTLKEQEYETPEILELEGDVFHQLDAHEKSRELWLQAVELVPTSDRHLKLARNYDESNNAEAARLHESLSHFFSGRDAYVENRLKSAEASLTEATRLHPGHADAWYLLGKVQVALGLREASRNSFESCLMIDSAHGRALDAIDHLGDKDSADRP